MNKLLLLVLLVVIAGGAFWYLKPNTAQRLLENSPLGSAGETTQLYKWRDSEGNWQITDAPPPPGIDYERKEYRADVNVLPVPPQLEAAAK